jgi:inorganic triphosphatase YgiF
MAGAPRQVEVRFSAPLVRATETSAVIEPLAGAESKARTLTYFDTPNGALRRANLALCVRREGDRYVQALMEGGEDARARWDWETEIAGPEPELDVLRGVPAGRRLARAGKLGPVCIVEVRRRTTQATEGESRIELAFDECVAKAGAKEAPFAELELELKSGPQEGLFALAHRLASSFDLILSFTTKAERGAVLAHPPRSYARKFNAPPLARSMTSADAFQRIALACLRQVAANAEGLRNRASPEVIHQMRVGLRRIRSLMTTFQKVAIDHRLPAIKAELKWISGELDPARNLDVLLHGGYRDAGQKDGGKGWKGLGVRLHTARRMAYVRALGAVESERFRRLLVDLFGWIEAGPWTVAEAVKSERARAVALLATKELSKRRRKIVKSASGFRGLSPKDRHKLRIEAKKLRYASDVFLGLFKHPKRAKAFMACLEEVQASLGELNDVVVGERLAQDAARSLGEAPLNFVAGPITGALKARVAPLMDRAEAALEALAKAKPFWK